MDTFGLSKGALGDPGGGEVEAKTGGEELSGDRGAHQQNKNKTSEADEEKKGPQGHPRGSTIVDLGPPLCRTICFT